MSQVPKDGPAQQQDQMGPLNNAATVKAKFTAIQHSPNTRAKGEKLSRHLATWGLNPVLL